MLSNGVVKGGFNDSRPVSEMPGMHLSLFVMVRLADSTGLNGILLTGFMSPPINVEDTIFLLIVLLEFGFLYVSWNL